ncbi:protein polybromo-1 isoform X2 [Lepeophtheirus salmonis]|uniref:protein polybromo-1 isoform X2 n=1 Tax=Lepeophtheirus salmonis TaxID=72036 RepID=UPI003AF3E7FA
MIVFRMMKVTRMRMRMKMMRNFMMEKWANFSNILGIMMLRVLQFVNLFLILPSKKLFPDYYQTISNPISLNMIRKKLKNKEYGKLSDMVNDMNIMFENCKAYNRSDSQIFKEGVKLQRLMTSKVEEIQSGKVVPNGMIEIKETVVSPHFNSNSTHNIVALKNMRILYNTILIHKDDEGVQLVSAFMELPSKKDYPDYYEVIEHPMDMNTINNKIKNGAYKNEEEYLQDMKLMFANCKKYNEERSEIYKDAVTLERVLIAKGREIGLSAGLGRGRPSKKKFLSSDSKNIKMKALFDALRDYKDVKGRQLSLIFLRLPNQRDFADYYEVIKKPIDFEKISTKIKTYVYDNLEETLADFILMFDNACKFNEPDSQIYKDALTLQSLALKVAREMNETAGSVTDVAQRVQDILNSIFIAVYNHQDENGRSFSDSMSEIPEYDIKIVNDQEVKTRALSLDIIKRRLDRVLYKRLDFFQRDVFSVFERARNLSTSDSLIFEDSVELQAFFIKVRDEFCERGTLLKSRALLYTQVHLDAAITALKAKKFAIEKNNFPNEDLDNSESSKINGATNVLTVSLNSQEYKVGDYVYISSNVQENNLIYRIEKMYSGEGILSFYGTQFLYPKDTHHLPTRKFLDREVFSSDVRKIINLSEVVGKCVVLTVKDYLKYIPEGIHDDDVWVCESQYVTRNKYFTKLKTPYEFIKRNVNLKIRESSIVLRRIPSVYKHRVERQKAELEEIEAMEKSLGNIIPPNVLWNPIPFDYPLPQPLDEGITYFEQYTIPGPITLKRGDNVYVRAENGKNLIVQIDTMWTTSDGMAYFHGPWFVTPSETPQNPSQSFYKQEVFLSTISDTNPLLSAVGKCTVFEVTDYTTRRPSEVVEGDVYVCESIFDETKRAVRGLLPPTGLKKYSFNSGSVQEDEIYFFKKPIHIQKVPERVVNPLPPTPKMSLSNNFEVDNEDSLDGISSVCSNTSVVEPTPKKWKQLSDLEKQVYEERAKKVNKENEIKFLQEQRAFEEKKRQELMNHSGTSTPISFGNNGNITFNAMPSTPASSKNALSMISINNTNQRNFNCISPAPSPGPPVMTNTKVIEPIFHTVPPRPQKLLHSEAYIKYIEGLTTESHSMSNWERQLQATKENTKTDEAQLPAHWLSDNGQHGTSLDALWALREFMMSDSLGIYKL